MSEIEFNKLLLRHKSSFRIMVTSSTIGVLLIAWLGLAYGWLSTSGWLPFILVYMVVSWVDALKHYFKWQAIDQKIRLSLGLF